MMVMVFAKTRGQPQGEAESGLVKIATRQCQFPFPRRLASLILSHSFSESSATVNMGPARIRWAWEIPWSW